MSHSCVSQEQLNRSWVQSVVDKSLNTCWQPRGSGWPGACAVRSVMSAASLLHSTALPQFQVSLCILTRAGSCALPILSTSDNLGCGHQLPKTKCVVAQLGVMAQLPAKGENTKKMSCGRKFCVHTYGCGSWQKNRISKILHSSSDIRINNKVKKKKKKITAFGCSSI